MVEVEHRNRIAFLLNVTKCKYLIQTCAKVPAGSATRNGWMHKFGSMGSPFTTLHEDYSAKWVALSSQGGQVNAHPLKLITAGCLQSESMPLKPTALIENALSITWQMYFQN